MIDHRAKNDFMEFYMVYSKKQTIRRTKTTYIHI